MATTLQYEIPARFTAIPLRHKTPKSVCGKFIRTFEVAEVEPGEVTPLMDVGTGSELGRFFTIDGGFYWLLGEISAEQPRSFFSAGNSPIPGFAETYNQARTRAHRDAREAGLPLFPKQGAIHAAADNILEYEWFEEQDLERLAEQHARAESYLSSLRCCGGLLYQPMHEPAFIVTAVCEGQSVVLVDVEFSQSNKEHFYIGQPVAYYCADQEREAMDHAMRLSTRYGIKPPNRRERHVVVHEPANLTFDPFPFHALDACWLALTAATSMPRPDRPDGSEIASLISAACDLIGPGSKAWRNERASDALTAMGEEAERLARELMVHVGDTPGFPSVIVDELLGRWDERPMGLKVLPAIGSGP